MDERQAQRGDSERIAEFCTDLDFSTGVSLGRSNQGEVRRFNHPEFDLAIKTPNGSGPLRWLRLQSLRREYRTYQRLAGVPGFARCHGLFEGDLLVLDYIEGENFRRSQIADPQAFFAELLQVIQAMHGRGVAHGDLKRKDNLRIDSHGRPVILDLGTAVLRQDNAGWLNRRLFDFACQTDLNAWVKLKHGGYTEVPAEDLRYLKRSGLERTLSWLRGHVDT